MLFANTIKLSRHDDHFVLRFALTDDGDPEAVAEVAIPLTAGIGLALNLFEATYASVAGLQKRFVEFQTGITKLNDLAANAAENEK